MAKKIILKDLDNIEILPITRGELILDSSGRLAFRSNEFLATDSLPGLMSSEDKYKLDNLENSGPGANDKVAQINTTTNDVYRLLFSETADDTDRTEKSRKSANLTFNPSTGVLNLTGTINANGGIISTTSSYYPLRIKCPSSYGQTGIRLEVDNTNMGAFISTIDSTYIYNFDNSIGLGIYKGVAKIGDNTLIHSGNIGLYSMVFDKSVNNGAYASSSKFNTVGYGNTAYDSGWKTYGPILTFGIDAYHAQLQKTYNSDTLYIRSYINGTYTDWKEIAFTDSDITGNANTASKLQNKVKIWGLDFDGTADVKGNLTLGYNQIYIGDGTDNFRIGWGNNNMYCYHNYYGHYFSTKSGEVMSINSSGNVGIGTADPKYKLDVNGIIRSTTEIHGNIFYFTSNEETKGWFGSPNNTGATDFVLNVFPEGALRFYTNDAEQMRINSDGKIGIGTNAPLYKLHVNGISYTDKSLVAINSTDANKYGGSSNYYHLAIGSKAANYGASILLYRPDKTTLQSIVWSTGSNDHAFIALNANTDDLKIDNVKGNIVINNAIINQDIHKFVWHKCDWSFKTGTWYRIMESSSSNVADATGDLIIYLHTAGYPATVKLSFGITYHNHPFLFCNWATAWSGSAFTKARIVYKTSYGNLKAYLEVYAGKDMTHTTTFVFLGIGWSLITPTATTEAYTESLNSKCEISLGSLMTVFSNNVYAPNFVGTVDWSNIANKPTYWANVLISSTSNTATIPTLGGLITTGVIQSSSNYPAYLTSIGTGVYNKTVIMHSADGLIIERARKTESFSGKIIPLIISQRGGGSAVTFKNNDVLVSGRVESTENYIWENGTKYRVTTYGYQGIGRIYNYNEDTSTYGTLYIGRNSADAMIIKPNGYVGIARDPAYVLDVQNNARVASICFEINDEINRYGGDLYLQHRGTIAGTLGDARTGNVVMCLNGKNVLIGTTTSISKLSVAGDVGITGSYVFTPNATSTIGTLYSTTDKTLYNRIKINAGPEGILYYSGTWTSGVHAAHQFLTKDSTSSDALVRMVIMNVTGNVGIGTKNPAYKLEVGGTAGVKRLNVLGGEVTDCSKAIYFFASDNSTRARIYYNGNTSDGSLGIESYYSNIVIMPPSGKNVGIGISDPTQKLHVAGLVNITANSGTLTIGCLNTSWTHYSTTGGTHWFNKAVEVNGNLTPHANNSFTLGTSSKRWSNVYSVLGNFSGNITVGGNQYVSDSTYGINMLNSDIALINSLYFADLADSSTKGIHFYRSTTTWDSLTAKNGILYFSGNRAISDGTLTPVFSALANSGNNISITIGGQNRTLTPAYATSAGSADIWDGRHFSASFAKASDINWSYLMWTANGACSDVSTMGYAAVMNVGTYLYRGWLIWNSRNDHKLYWRPVKSDVSGWADVHTLLDSHNYTSYTDGRYVNVTGDTMTGPLTFANGTWNVVGDDAAIGDYNAAGMLGLKSINNNIPGIGFHNSSNTLLGRLQANGSNLLWNDNKIWHAGNDGSGSGLDADTVDGVHASSLPQIKYIGFTGDYCYDVILLCKRDEVHRKRLDGTLFTTGGGLNRYHCADVHFWHSCWVIGSYDVFNSVTNKANNSYDFRFCTCTYGGAVWYAIRLCRILAVSYYFMGSQDGINFSVITYYHTNNGVLNSEIYNSISLINSNNMRYYGDIYANHFYESSDIALKDNIKSIINSDNIPQLKSFDWKSDGSHSYGLIALELEEMGYPELVSSSGSYKTVNYSAALSLIVGKLQVKIKELEKEIEILKNKN